MRNVSFHFSFIKKTVLINSVRNTICCSNTKILYSSSYVLYGFYCKEIQNFCLHYRRVTIEVIKKPTSFLFCLYRSATLSSHWKFLKHLPSTNKLTW